MKNKVTNRPKTVKELKTIIKRGSSTAIAEFLSHLYQQGYMDGIREITEQLREQADEHGVVQSESEQSDDGEVSVD